MARKQSNFGTMDAKVLENLRIKKARQAKARRSREKAAAASGLHPMISQAHHFGHDLAAIFLALEKRASEYFVRVDVVDGRLKPSLVRKRSSRTRKVRDGQFDLFDWSENCEGAA